MTHTVWLSCGTALADSSSRFQYTLTGVKPRVAPAVPNRGHLSISCSLTAWRHKVPSRQCLQQSMLKSIFPVNRKLFQTLAMGQGLGLLICATAITSQYLATSFHVNAPMLQSLFNYALLCVTYTSMLLCRRGGSNTHHTAQRLSRCYNPLSLN